MASPLSLVGVRILVTGAGRGIGRAMAHVCHAEGARVAVCARTLSDLQETVALVTTCSSATRSSTTAKENDAKAISNEEQEDRFLLLPCDVTNETQVESMVETIVQQWGGIDILINNAGGGQASKGEVSMLSSTDFRQLLNLNVVAVHSVTSSVLRRGSTSLRCIVNVSSRAGKTGLPGNAFYCASKFALEGYSATLAEELRTRTPPIVVNTISPGMVDTASFPKPPGRLGVRTAESVRDGLLLLLQTEVTGHYLHVDELDQVRAKGLPDTMALRPINEIPFSP